MDASQTLSTSPSQGLNRTDVNVCFVSFPLFSILRPSPQRGNSDHGDNDEGEDDHDDLLKKLGNREIGMTISLALRPTSTLLMSLRMARIVYLELGALPVPCRPKGKGN